MKNHGWIHQDKKTGWFWNIDYFIGSYKKSISLARVYPTRKAARMVACAWDTIRKVSLTKEGKPKKIIGNG